VPVPAMNTMVRQMRAVLACAIAGGVLFFGGLGLLAASQPALGISSIVVAFIAEFTAFGVLIWSKNVTMPKANAQQREDSAERMDAVRRKMAGYLPPPQTPAQGESPVEPWDEETMEAMAREIIEDRRPPAQ
jgi:hypothetical protein